MEPGLARIVGRNPDSMERNMTDERNIAHDKKVAQNKKSHGEAVVENAAVAPQPGKKPHLIDDHTSPSNSVASAIYKQGEEPRVHRDDDHDAKDEKDEASAA